MALPPIPEGFALDTPAPASGLPPIPDGFALDSPAAPVPVVSDVNYKSRRSLGKAQRELLEQNPDFKMLPKKEQQRLLLGSKNIESAGGLKDLVLAPAGGDVGLGLVKDLAQTGYEGLASVVNAGKKALGYFDQAGKWVDTALGTGFNKDKADVDRANAEFMQYDQTPSSPLLPMPAEPSALGGSLATAIEPVTNAIQNSKMGQNDPRLAEKVVDLVALATMRKPGAAAERAMYKAPAIVAEQTVNMADRARNSFSPRASKPVESFTDANPTPTDKVQAGVNRRAALDPAANENRFVNSLDALSKPERATVDPTIKAGEVSGVKRGLENLEQQANEGKVFEHDAQGRVVTGADGQPVPYQVGKGGINGAFMPIKQMLDNIWQNEVLPILQRAKVSGLKVGMDGVADQLTTQAKRLGGSLGRSLETRAAELRGTQLDPVQMQNRATAINELIYGNGKDIMPLEDTIQRNALRQELGAINDLLNKTVDTHLDTLGLGDLKQHWGGGRKLLDYVMDGIERKQAISGHGAVPVASAGVDVAAGALTGRPGLILRGVSKVGPLYRRMLANPDVAFETLIRTKRAMGNPTRETFGGQIRPEPLNNPEFAGPRANGNLGDVVPQAPEQPGMPPERGLEAGGQPPRVPSPYDQIHYPSFQLTDLEAQINAGKPRGVPPEFTGNETPFSPNLPPKPQGAVSGQGVAPQTLEPHPTYAGQNLAPPTTITGAGDMAPPPQFPRVPATAADTALRSEPTIITGNETPLPTGAIEPHPTGAGLPPTPPAVLEGAGVSQGQTPVPRGQFRGEAMPPEAFDPSLQPAGDGINIVSGNERPGLTSFETARQGAGGPKPTNRAGLNPPLAEQMRQAAVQNLDPKMVDQFWRAVDANKRNNNGPVIDALARKMGFKDKAEAITALKAAELNGGM